MPSIPRIGRSDKDKSAREEASELVRLVVAYARQETVDPLKALGRFLVFGLAGALLLGIGCVLLVLAVLRLLQTELSTHLSGSLTWVPYTGAMLFALIVAGLAARRITKVPR